MLARTSERKMRLVRSGLLLAWLVLLVSLLWDPLTPALTRPERTGSPFHLNSVPVLVQGKPLDAEPYSMGPRIFWTMVLPVVPLALMLFGHETWRRVCPLSHISQIPGLLGRQRKVKRLNRTLGRVDKLLALVPGQSWIGRNHLYFQFGFLIFGVLGRLLFYNSNRLALAIAFAVVMAFALIVGFFYGGKTWCNYFCPVSVIQAIYTGPGGLLDSKAHVSPAPITQSMCRTPSPMGDRSACVGCTSFCRDVDLENSYWKTAEADKTRLVYYGFFGLVFAFYTYYYVYSGGWDYYMTGSWTHESGQLASLLSPGFFIGGTAVPIPKIIAAPLYFAACIGGSYWLFAGLERIYVKLISRLGEVPNKLTIRHHLLTVCAFLTFNLFYFFAGRPNIRLMPAWAIRLIDLLIVFVSVAWLLQSLARDSGIYRRERLARTLRDQLTRMGFRSEDALDGQSIDGLSADEIYVLAKTLPNFSLAQKREAYRAVMQDTLETGHIQSADSLTILSDLRAQLGLSEADHHAIVESVGISDPTLLDPEIARSVELRSRRDSYKKYLLDHVANSLNAESELAAYLTSPNELELLRPVRELFNISEEDHVQIVGQLVQTKGVAADRASRALGALCQLEAARFSLNLDVRPQARLLRHALGLRRHVLARDIARLAGSIQDAAVGRSFGQSVYSLAGRDTEADMTDGVAGLPESLRQAFLTPTSDPVYCSYLDVIEAAKTADEVIRSLTADRDPIVAAIAASGLLSIDPDAAKSVAGRLAVKLEQPACVTDDVVAGVLEGVCAGIVTVMTDLLAVPVFAALDLRTLADIARRSRTMTFSAGDQICRVGESADWMFVLSRGEAKAWLPRNGERVLVDRRKRKAVFGELGILTGRPYSASVEVTSETATVIAIPRDVLNDLLNRDLRAARGILTVVSSFLSDMLAETEVANTRTGAAELAATH